MRHGWMQRWLSVTGLTVLQATLSAMPQPPNSLMPTNVEHPSPAKPTIDLHVAAAGIEVAWLRDAATYPYALWADPTANGNAVLITGFVPSDALRQKVLLTAQKAAVGILVQDQLTVQRNMMLAADSAADKDQARVVKDHLDKSAPHVAKQLQVTVDSQGVATIGGRIDELRERRKIIRALQGIPGCTAIRYELRVATPQVLSPALTTVASRELTPVPTIPSKEPFPSKKAVANADGMTPTRAFLSKPATVSATTAVKSPSNKPTIVKVAEAKSANEAARSIDSSKLTIASLSGLTPPEPSVALGQPVISRPLQNSFLIGLPVLPKVGDRPLELPSKPPELTKSVVQAHSVTPALSEPAPLPIILFEPTPAHCIVPAGNTELIGPKPK